MTLSDLTYAAQFEVLRVWLGTLTPDELVSRSVLPGWSVADLLAHLAGTGQAISALRPGEPTDQPISIADYVANYAPAATEIADIARAARLESGAELLAAIDQAHAGAQRHLDELGAADRVVISRRGPILLSDFLDTRLIELVVHSQDLARSLPDRSPPTILPSAQRRVVAVLRELLTGRALDPVGALAAASELAPQAFVELAAGRRAAAPDLPPALAGALPLF